MVHFGNFVPGFTFFPLWTLTVCLSTAVWMPVKGQSQLIGSSQPIMVALGDDVILPCCVEPQLNVEDLTVEWWRPDLLPDPGDPLSLYKYVHRYRDNHDVEDMKMSSYAGRTTLFKDELKHGNVSLKITDVKLSDQGSYRCFIPQLGRATIIRIVVDPDSVKTWMTEIPVLPINLQTPDQKEETDIKGGRCRQGVWIPAVVFCVLVILGVCGCAVKHKLQKLNASQKETDPVV